MRYTIEKQNEVKLLAESGKSLEYIMAATSLPRKVICSWVPDLRPHEDIIKQSVKQRYHFLFPDWEAKVTTVFSKYIKEDISDDEWDEMNTTVYSVLFDVAVKVFTNAITDLPSFSGEKKLSSQPILEYLKSYWKTDNQNLEKCNEDYIKTCRNTLHYWSFLRKKTVKDITTGDLQLLIEKLKEKELSPSRIYTILSVGVIPLKDAFEKGLTLIDFTRFKMPSKNNKTYKIDKEVLANIFSSKWIDEEAYWANLIACEGRMKLSEIKGLRVKDIEEDYIHCKKVLIQEDLKDAYHSRKIYVSKPVMKSFITYVKRQNLKEEDLVFKTSKIRNTWNDALKKQSAPYIENGLSFAVWNHRV